MIIEPKTRGFICVTTHPEGCKKNVQNQIDYVKSKGKQNGPKNVLVIGSSTGYGLSSRIVSAFGNGASTIGVFFERPGSEKKTATAGWYNSWAFEEACKKENIYAKSINGDAFSHEIKKQTIDLIKADLGKVDMVIYSLASPRRTDPNTKIDYSSVLKPLGGTYTSKTVDTNKNEVHEISIEPANPEEIQATVKVMGGEDWEMWIELLRKEGCLSDNAVTVAYSYIGPKITFPVYRHGTIGQAKEHLENTAKEMTKKNSDIGLKAYVSVNKAVVTQASSAIPVVPLYISLLFKVMKEKNTHEDCIEQIDRLYREFLFKSNGVVPVDEKGLIRIDDLEMAADVQAVTDKLWTEVNTENLLQLSDYEGYKKGFLALFGFGIEGVNYQEDVNPVRDIPSIPHVEVV